MTSYGGYRVRDPIEGGSETRWWLDAVKESLVGCFANDLEDDLAAVREVITSPWSNGHMERQITRLKLIKRRMYEPAELDLLKARLIVAT
ncbi:transposase [Shinella sp. JR1-6]|nr:transposase [Shinella sp. JR1-6]